ncbi:hypothetical protein [Cognaticolwellia mytili]|uniref:hypothetical protein n=1 Tax=Cognaticolwellia mytili TaxID=1888913 RepID=UPI000A171E76|nr:hypothetical protein [Cognaticolwellia mytili]
MSHAKTDSEITPDSTFSVHMNFAQLAADIKLAATKPTTKNPEELKVQFNGKGHTVSYIPENLEDKYFHYTSSETGLEIIKPPFEINNGNTVACILVDNDNSGAKGKWKGIVQNNFDLQQVSKSSTQVIYKASLTEGADDIDDVIIQISFKLDGEKYYVAWDPRIRVVRG